jgi:hypothetical protein
MLLREDDGFNLRYSKLDLVSVVLGRIESHKYVSGLVFDEEEDATQQDSWDQTLDSRFG